MKVKMAGNEWYWINFKYENVPTFYFICGVIGHSERFYNKLFEVPESEIKKPYGPWMRAPFKSQVKLIDAKWLRSGFESGGSSTETEAGSGSGAVNESNLDLQFSPTSMEDDIEGVNLGADKFQNFNKEAGKDFGISSTTQPLIVERVNTDNVVIIESKKRRTEDGLDSNNDIIMGLNRDIQMLLEHEKHTNSSKTETGSKNAYVAGTQGSAR